jgi:hypothetical protein
MLSAMYFAGNYVRRHAVVFSWSHPSPHRFFPGVSLTEGKTVLNECSLFTRVFKKSKNQWASFASWHFLIQYFIGTNFHLCRRFP